MREMTMRERVARAIHGADCGCGATSIDFDEGYWPALADAVLAALREPTEAMVEAVDDVDENRLVGQIDRIGGAFLRDAAPRLIWQAMLDAASPAH